ncbi:tripartite motif-containing protein 44 [Vanacampus margaritifer]
MSQEDLPLMDGTCDACEPDEAQMATQVCHTCTFAFCCLHADRHGSSTHHPLAPYKKEGAHANGLNSNNEQNADLRQAATGDDMNGHGSKNPLQGAESSEDRGEDMAAKDAVKKDTVSVVRLRCADHGQEGSLYCKQDEKIICVVCAMQGEHQGHEIITLYDAYNWQKNRQGLDLLDCTRQMEEKIAKKWTKSEMSSVELEAYVSSQFDGLRKLVSLEEKKALHLLDLKEAFLTASAAEKIAEINVQTERLEEEVASITHQLYLLDQGKLGQVLAAGALAEASGPGHTSTLDFEASPRLPVPRAAPVDPHDFEESNSRPSMDHAP